MNEIPLRRWQQDAVTRWVRSGGSGIIEAATGSGKTRVALAAVAAAESVWQSDLRVAVVVPTRALMYQWRQRFREFGLWTVDLLGDGHHPVGNASTTIAVINSAREHLPALLERWRREDKVSMLVVDECHRAGSPSNAKIFEGPIDFTLGISATPHRDGDTATDTVIIPALGDVIMTYTRADAERDGVVSPVDLVDISVELEDFERNEYFELTSKIDTAREWMLREYPFLSLERDLVRAVGDLRHRQYREGEVDPVLEIWTTAIMNRRRLLARSKNRRRAAEDLLRSLPMTEQGYLFHEQISEAERTYELLKDEDVAVGLFHSKLDKEIQERSLSDFRAGKLRWLACVRALDEGIDTPNATTAVIVAGTYSRRQLIQRLGRVSRPHGGDRSVAFRILVENEIERAPRIGGRHATISWPEDLSTICDPASIEASLGEPTSDDDDLFDDDGLDVPVWSKDANPARNLMIPVVDRVLQANIVKLSGEFPVRGPARAVDRARRHVQEASALLSQLKDAMDTPYLGSGWPDRLRRSNTRLRTQLSAGRGYTPTRFHAARTKARHDLREFENERIRASESEQEATHRRLEKVRRSLEGKKGELLLEAHASGHPVDVYVNNIEGSVAHVTVRRTLLTSRIDLPPGYNWEKNTIQSVRVVEFNRNTGALTLEIVDQ